MAKRTIILVTSGILAKLMMFTYSDFVKYGKFFETIIFIAYWCAFTFLLMDIIYCFNKESGSYHFAAMKVDASSILEIFLVTLVVFGTLSECLLFLVPMLVMNTIILIKFVIALL